MPRTLLFLLLLATLACKPQGAHPNEPKAAASQIYDENDYQDSGLDSARLHDKVLGFLLGSAIGDAMGAPTEMWWRKDISEHYGYVDTLDLLMREPSPEGPWGRNLPPGAGTDDTRWKALTIEFLLAQGFPVGQAPQLSAAQFADYITQRYRRSLEELKTTAGLDPEPYEVHIMHFTWLQEWVRITRAYSSGDLDAYRDALSRFYGGEMACAGMLYAPAVGAFYPGRPKVAYAQMYELALFDLGYARDISALTAALTAQAFDPGFRLDSLKKTLITVDPEGFFDARLLSRIAYQQFAKAESIVRAARKLGPEDLAAHSELLELPAAYPYDSLHYLQTLKAYELLAAAEQDVPFHAGEIHLINLTALLFSDLDFSRALEFVVNFGRDNDTVAAVTGAILGAYHGAAALPREQSALVLQTNREVLNLDLEQLAKAMTEAILKRRANHQH
ncbi:MAG: ADP-ribosylglycohydrolase family protein [Lewinella sp.]|nr:ADP-ribosylglycohydrolase family protein [Lewinella sp.]